MTIQIQNKHLQVLIDEPGSLYTGSRFDWSGQISQITLDGKHHFCSVETLDKDLQTISGRGFCNEFGIETCIGYKDCTPGDYFPKIGVGLLQKESEKPYFFFTQYRIQPANFIVNPISSNGIQIDTSIENHRGYGFMLTKKYEIDDHSLVVHYQLENTGAKILETEEYSHNFAIVDDIPMGNSYRLSFPQKINIADLDEKVNPADSVSINEDNLTWNSTPPSDFFFSKIGGSSGAMNSWELENSKAGVGLRETCDFQPIRCNVWGKAHVISPELFHWISVKPGQTKTWKRKYDFYFL